jgi:hypothetical protein
MCLLSRENYDLCTRIKHVEGLVRSMGAQLAMLERDKAMAVHAEDYDRAAQLKQVRRASGVHAGRGGMRQWDDGWLRNMRLCVKCVVCV